ncbi:hypothetical protein IFR05_011556 [Cadophora sp. M221]|nr:hypothetical protein IFR05_011556 [Cadophora sp. M221]
MRISTCALGKGITATLIATTVSAVQAQAQKAADIVPGAYIVEFGDLAAGSTAFYSNLSNSNISAVPRLRLKHELFNGVSFRVSGPLDNESTMETIFNMSMVSNIWPMRLYSRLATVRSSSGTSDPSFLRKREEVDTYSTHVMGGVDKLHAQGLTGDGIFIGVIDSGVDCNHPALGGGFGPGFKDVTGADLVGNDYDGGTVPVPDDFPLDCLGHGTHVTGILAADANPYGFIGVAPNATLEIASDGCEPLPDSTPDLSEYIVLVRRGICTFELKANNIAAKGAKRVIFYNNIPSTPVATLAFFGGGLPIPAGMTTDAQGASWIAALSAGSNVTVRLSSSDVAPVIFDAKANTLTAGKMSIFSTWGPTYEGWIKPEVAAPGGYVLSTLPLNQGGYAVESGTSMAAPYISGVVALLMQKRGKKFATENIVNLLASTAKPVNFNDGSESSPLLAPVIQQGGGLVNAYQAVNTGTLVKLDNIALNDTDNFKAVHKINIKNIGSLPQTYTFGHLVAATAYTFTPVTLFPKSFSPDLSSTGATVSFSSSSITIKPDSSTDLVATFVPPAGLDASILPVYGGYVTITGSNGDILQVPYSGIAGSLVSTKLMNTDSGYPLQYSSEDINEPSVNGTVYSLSNPTVTPIVFYSLVMGTRMLKIEVVSLSDKGKQNVIGAVRNTPLLTLPRGDGNPIMWDMTVGGQKVVPGTYLLRLSVLRILGNVKKDWEVYDLPTMVIGA